MSIILQQGSQVSAAAEEVLPIATELARRLSGANVRYGVYKNRESVAAGLSGLADLDLIVAVADIDRFRAVLADLKAISGRPGRFHDNAVEGREDWFVPDFSRGDYLHLDVTTGLRIGHKFRKRYLALSYDDVTEWQALQPPWPAIPVVSPQEEARIAFLRSMFRLLLWHGSSWVRLDHQCSKLLLDSATDKRAGWSFSYRVGARQVTCAVRNNGSGIEVESRSVRRLRELLRRDGHGARSLDLWDFVVHQTRRLIHSGTRRLTGFSPAMTAAKRSPGPGGILIAIVGPDGVGKSTQVARLAAIFQKKFRCTTAYLGSGSGTWMLSRMARRRYRRWRAERQSAPNAIAKARDAASGKFQEIASAISGLESAIERYVTLHLARRMVEFGAIVICDRWPQDLRPGLLDGPRNLPPNASRGASLLSWFERRLYHGLEQYKPGLAVHLVADFETSFARKPGGIKRPGYERRLSLMREMRERDSEIEVVDAGQDLAEVTLQLFQCAWLALWKRALVHERNRDNTHTKENP